MEEKQCKNCQHYMQHFALDKSRIFSVYCGHCTLGRVKRKLPDAKACEDFILGTVQNDAFVSKEYLSKELLQYMLRLGLLPEIEEIG